jgi:hypothetical protein
VLGIAIALAPGGARAGSSSKGSQVPGGRTIGGPAETTLPAGESETLASQIPSVDACVTLVNTGTASVDLSLAGGGTGTISVPTHTTAVLCHAGLQSVSVLGRAAGNGTCSMSWRLDSAG